jgi:predicted AlkP superfamily phosphohydrolase/phosphomutase
MKKPVIAIGLDAAEPALIDKWMSQGHLKNLRRLREQGTAGRLKNFEYYRAETPWTTFLTGCSPRKTGYWSPIKFHEHSYAAELIEAYDYGEYQPFYALGDDYRVAVFDMPQSTLSERVNGLQVLGWGAHSAQTPSHSQPAPLFEELVSKHGSHPGLRKDHASCFDVEALRRLQDVLERGIARRAAICQDLLEREPWDLFLTIFGEPHSVGHFMWHLSQPDHPLYEVYKSQAWDSMLEVFEAVDRAIGEILTKAPEDAHIVVFSVHGMGTNVMDLTSTTLLPEFLYRFNFPGKYGIARGQLGKDPGPPITKFKKQSWRREVWGSKYETNPLVKFLRRHAPGRIEALEKRFGSRQKHDLVSPFELYRQSDPLFFQPAMWYKNCWPHMKAFALPSFSEGYIRINLQGRDAQGIVPPEDYDALCDEITEKLSRLTDARTGTPMVKEVIRTRTGAMDSDPKRPDADLVVIWQEEYATDTMDSPDVGRIGPLPHIRTGSHRSEGFYIAKGPGIEANSDGPSGHSLDLTPTLLSLMDAPIPQYFDGKPLLETKVLAG